MGLAKFSTKMVDRDSNRELTEEEVTFFKNLLEQQKEELFLKKISSKEEFYLDIEERSDDVDHANADISNFQKIRFRSRENMYEKKLDEALRRIQNGEYGLCKECGGPIGHGRLLARPTAELCIQCKEEAEREEYFNKTYSSQGSVSSLFGVSN